MVKAFEKASGKEVCLRDQTNLGFTQINIYCCLHQRSCSGLISNYMYM